MQAGAGTARVCLCSVCVWRGGSGQAEPGAAAGRGLAGRTAAGAGQRCSSVALAAAEEDRLPGTILRLLLGLRFRVADGLAGWGRRRQAAACCTGLYLHTLIAA